MSRYWSSIVHRLTPHVAGEQPAIADLVKLNTNENPYGPSPHVIAAIKAHIGDALRLYPDPSAFRLRATIASCYGIDADQVFVGNGSDEVLAHTFQALLQHDDPLLFPDITYSFYPTYCKLYGIEFREVPVGEAMQVRIADYIRIRSSLSMKHMSISAEKQPYRSYRNIRTCSSFRRCPNHAAWRGCV